MGIWYVPERLLDWCLLPLWEMMLFVYMRKTCSETSLLFYPSISPRIWINPTKLKPYLWILKGNSLSSQQIVVGFASCTCAVCPAERSLHLRCWETGNEFPWQIHSCSDCNQGNEPFGAQPCMNYNSMCSLALKLKRTLIPILWNGNLIVSIVFIA